MKNRSLDHIASGAMSLDLKPVEVCIRGAAQMEKLAKFLAVASRVFGTRDATCGARDSQRCLLHEPRQTCGGRGQPLYTILPLYCSYAEVLADSEEPSILFRPLRLVPCPIMFDRQQYQAPESVDSFGVLS